MNCNNQINDDKCPEDCKECKCESYSVESGKCIDTGEYCDGCASEAYKWRF